MKAVSYIRELQTFVKHSASQRCLLWESCPIRIKFIPNNSSYRSDKTVSRLAGHRLSHKQNERTFFCFTVRKHLKHEFSSFKYFRLEISISRFKYFQTVKEKKIKFQVFPDCHGKKKTNSFVSFLGESMARQSAFGFIWALHSWIDLVKFALISRSFQNAPSCISRSHIDNFMHDRVWQNFQAQNLDTGR